MTVAVIPARGGSKRIPRKNIRPFCGRPVIAYVIEAALQSGCFDRVIVSTDDEEIARVARSEGADIPFLRPAQLSDDFTGTAAVVRHALEWLSQQQLAPANACCLYATAPFLTQGDIRRGLELLEASDADYAVTVATYAFPVQRAMRVRHDQRLEMLFPEHVLTRSQDLEECYHDAGQMYWGRSASFLSGIPLLGPGSIPIVLPRHRVQDLDTWEDWARAELMYEAWIKAGQT